jgi:hypothetical protein
VGLALAGALSSGMALYHFFLPSVFHWGDALTRTPMLRWGLGLINASFSYLLLAGGVLSLAMALRPGLKQGIGRWVIVAMGVYWLMNAAWQVLEPMPMPRSMAGLRWAFLGYSVAVALLYASALVGRRRPVAASSLTVVPGRRVPGAGA